jgi:hypothetical protein
MFVLVTIDKCFSKVNGIFQTILVVVVTILLNNQGVP